MKYENPILNKVIDNVPHNKKNDHHINIHDLKPLIKRVPLLVVIPFESSNGFVKSDCYPDVDAKVNVSH